MSRIKTRTGRRHIRHVRLRKQISGTAERPRLAVFRSTRHIYVQAIDDEQGRTLASASTREKAVQPVLTGYTGNRDAAVKVGQAIAEALTKLGVKKVVFDRGGNQYHGRIKSLADSAREAGLQF